MLDPPAALESGDTFAFRSPPRGTPGMIRSSLSPRRTSQCWTPQQPSKAATVPQIAAPPGMVRSNLNPRSPPLRWTPQQPSKVATVSQIAAPQGW